MSKRTFDATGTNSAMSPKVNAPEALVLDLLEWLDAAPRSYVDVMEIWRTSCPRLPVWEDALDLGLVRRRAGVGREAVVEVTAAGIEWLRARRSSTMPAAMPEDRFDAPSR